MGIPLLDLLSSLQPYVQTWRIWGTVILFFSVLRISLYCMYKPMIKCAPLLYFKHVKWKWTHALKRVILNATIWVQNLPSADVCGVDLLKGAENAEEDDDLGVNGLSPGKRTNDDDDDDDGDTRCFEDDDILFVGVGGAGGVGKLITVFLAWSDALLLLNEVLACFLGERRTFFATCCGVSLSEIATCIENVIMTFQYWSIYWLQIKVLYNWINRHKQICFNFYLFWNIVLPSDPASSLSSAKYLSVGRRTLFKPSSLCPSVSTLEVSSARFRFRFALSNVSVFFLKI